MPLQKLVGAAFSVFVEILLWILPVVGLIGGCILGGFGYGLLGLIGGLLIDIFVGGPLVVLLNIRSSLKNLENK